VATDMMIAVGETKKIITKFLSCVSNSESEANWTKFLCW